jgi:hypothetical protein
MDIGMRHAFVDGRDGTDLRRYRQHRTADTPLPTANPRSPRKYSALLRWFRATWSWISVADGRAQFVPVPARCLATLGSLEPAQTLPHLLPLPSDPIPCMPWWRAIGHGAHTSSSTDAEHLISPAFVSERTCDRTSLPSPCLRRFHINPRHHALARYIVPTCHSTSHCTTLLHGYSFAGR